MMLELLDAIELEYPDIVVAQEPEEEEEMQQGSESGDGGAGDTGGFGGRAEGEIDPADSSSGEAGDGGDGWHHGGGYGGDDDWDSQEYEGEGWQSEEEYAGTGPQEGDKSDSGEGWSQTEGTVGDGSETQEYEGTGPVGGGEHEVQEGQCISSIAKDTGHFWETIWNDPGNTDLKEARGDPNVLLPGDMVTIPELTPKEETGETEQRHRFRRKGEPAKLRLRLVEEPEEEQAQQETEDGPRQEGMVTISEDPDVSQEPLEDRPRANVPYVLDIDGERFEGTTDSDGYLEEVPIPGNARGGTLILNVGTQDEERLAIQLGQLDPISEPIGVKQRLANLGFECGDRTPEPTAGLRQAILSFEQKNGMEPTGELTDEVRTRIGELHGS